MGKGYALIIGINKVQALHYNGWDGALSQPESDASLVKSKADEYSFESQLLITEDATRDKVIVGITNMALQAEAGDLVFIYYSGHGGQVPALESHDEDDHMNETWCLYDGQLVDDELYSLWSKFKEGVRVFLVSDSCHSGTISKVMVSKNELIPKNMPNYMMKGVYTKNVDFYNGIYKQLSVQPQEEIKISVLSYGGCQDCQSSYVFASDTNSLFTTHFIKMLDTPSINNPVGRSGGGHSYAEAIVGIQSSLREDVGRMQTPCIYEVGKKSSFRDEILLQIKR